MIAAPASTGAGWIKEISFSLANTPGEMIHSAMFGLFYFNLL
jgi:hypothetical protein